MAEFKIEDSELASIKDAVIVVTGASSGIGLATCLMLLSHSAKVVGGDLQPPPKDSVLASHSDYSYVHCDVTKWADQVALFQAAVEKYGRVDHVFANAGIATTSGDEYLTDVTGVDGTLQEPQRPMMAVNWNGAANTIKLGIHFLKKNEGGGSIVATASASSFFAMPMLIDYCVSKHALWALVQSLTASFAQFDLQKLRINALAPYWTATPLIGNSPPATAQPPSTVSRAAIYCMTASEQRGQCIYVMEERYFEMQAQVSEAMKKIIPQPGGQGSDWLENSREALRDL